ncbi:uncharacterized protein LOC135823444 [Sycon ciliatum]|uniref:uncharacterized protein LOC135823444 n=1 Tax=Sycon ciliatum TaxID=27933 RepID=UPI0031F5FFA9
MANRGGYIPIQNAPSDPAVASNEPIEWKGGLPFRGFQHLQRMSILVFAFSVANLGLQSYIPFVMDSSGEYNWSNVKSSAVWAAAVAFCVGLYMVIVSSGALRGMKHSKIHLIIGVVTCSLTCCLLVTGLVFSSLTSMNILTVQTDDMRRCIYYNSTSARTTAAPPVPLPNGCEECDPSVSWADGVGPNSCCCCYENWYGDYDSMTFYGVGSCQDVFTYVYPMSTASAILYGLSLLLAFLMAVSGCVVCCCRCYCCSSLCGPFPEDGGLGSTRRRTGAARIINNPTAYPAPVAAYPVAAASLPPAPVAQHQPTMYPSYQSAPAQPQPATNPSYQTAGAQQFAGYGSMASAPPSDESRQQASTDLGAGGPPAYTEAYPPEKV